MEQHRKNGPRSPSPAPVNHPHPRAEGIEALIEAEVSRALAPYRALQLPVDVLEEMESVLRLALRTHPTAQHLLRQLLPDPDVYKSDQIPRRGFDGVDDSKAGKA